MSTTIRWAVIAVLAAAPTQDEERDVRALIEQLGSEDLGQRESVKEQLLRKGRSIRKHLEGFLTSKSPELVAQVRSILDRFDWDEHLERSLPPERLVTIPQGRHTTEEILRTVREQTGCRVTAYAINLRAPIEAGWDRVPVLRVLDDVCRKLGRGTIEAPPLTARDDEDDGWRRRRERPLDQFIIDGDKTPPAATAHWKQFRGAVTDIVIQEHRSLVAGATRSRAHVEVNVTSQPGLQPVYIGGWRVEEAADDRGESLVIGDGGGSDRREGTTPEPGDDADAAWFTADRWSSGDGRATVEIKPPTAGAVRLRLRTKVRVAFAVKEATRTVTVADFKDAQDLVFGRVKLTVTAAANAERKFSLQYAFDGTLRGSPRFELLDKQGALIATRGRSHGGDGRKYYSDWEVPGGATVATVRVTAWVGHRAFDVPFEWTDIPIPAEDK